MDGQITMGVHVLQIGLDYPQIKTICKAAEDLGFDSVTLMDHFRPLFQARNGIRNGNLLECWTTLGALVRETKRIKIGPLVTCASYRNPALIAKIAASLDHISGGRLKFGIGSGSLLEEFEEFGVPLGKPAERIRRLEEAVQVIKKMWLEEDTSFDGKYYKIRHATCNPKPVQRPYPPIIIGGGGEQFTLKVVAKFADVWNCAGSIEDYERKLRILKKYCQDIGRNFDGIRLSRMAWVILSSDRRKIAESQPDTPDLDGVLKRHFMGDYNECAKRIQRFVDLGVTDFELVFPDTFFNRKDPSNIPSLETMKNFAEHVLPKFK